MALPSVRESPLPAAWSEVLDNVLQALEHTAQEAARLSEALDSPSPSAETSSPTHPESHSFDALRAIVGRAGRAVAEVEKLVSEEEQVVRLRLEKLATLGQRLADGPASGI
jgi:ABC-type transporter Mla subunit MlaD